MPRLFNHTDSKKNSIGFTMIEVMIVLAVAGMIVAVVLASVPQAQRNQRDNTRKSIAQRLMSSLETYNANTQGTYPFSGSGGTGQPTPADWTVDCKTQVVLNPAQTCYDWYSNYIYNSGNKIINISDPSSGSDATIRYSNKTANPSGVLAKGDIYIGVGDVCNGSTLSQGQAVGSPSSKQFAMLVILESSGGFYCTDNR